MKGKHKFKERLLAFVLAFAMIMGTVIQPIQLQAAGNQEQELDGQNFENNVQDDGGVPAPASLGDVGEPTEPGEETVTLNPTSATLTVGEKQQFTATVTPEGTDVTSWESSDENVAAVDQTGFVTAKGPGNATIMAKTDNGTKGTATVEVKAKKYMMTGSVVAENKIGIEGAQVTFDNGFGITSSGTTDENGEYSVPCVEGTYTVSASKNGMTMDAAQTAEVKEGGSLQVAAITMKLNDIALYGDFDSIKVEESTTWNIRKEFSVDGESISWETDNNSCVQINGVGENVRIIGLSEGTAKITATVKTKYGEKQDSKSIIVLPWNTVTTLTVTPYGTDKTESITLVATVKKEGTDTGVTGGQAEFSISKYKYDADTDTGTYEPITLDNAKVDVVEGTASYIFEPGLEYGLSGTYRFSVKYLGNSGKYNSSEIENPINENYKDLIPIRFEGVENLTEPQEVTYGDDYTIRINKDAFINAAGDVDDSKVQYTFDVKKEYETSLEVNSETGEVTFLNACDTTVYVTVTRGEAGNHKGISVDFPFKISKKKISIDESYAGLTYSKVYDKTDFNVLHDPDNADILTGVEEIPLTGIEAGDENSVSVADIKGTMPEGFENVVEDGNGEAAAYDNKADVTLTEVTLTGDKANNYEVDAKSSPITLKTTVTIQKRPIYLIVSDGEREYGHWNNITYADSEPVQENRAAYDNTNIQGLVGEDKVEFPKPEEVEIPDENKPDYALGQYENKLTVEEWVNGQENGNPGNNYKFDYENVEKGALTVIEEAIGNYMDYLDFDEASGNAYISKEDSNEVWGSGQNTSFQIYPQKSGQGAFYDQVILADEEQNLSEEGSGVDLSGFTEKEDGAEKSIEVYLKCSKNGATSKKFTVKIKVDTKDAEVTSTSISEKIHGIPGFVDTITFGKFHNQLSAKIETANVSDGAGSGVAQWSYNIMSGDSDKSFTEDAIETYTDPTQDTCTWTLVSEKDENSDNAELSGAIPLPDKENNYVVLLKLEDNVGHCKVYASNGIIIDYVEPKASISLDDNQPESATGIYGGDVNLNIHVQDVVSEVTASSSAVKKVELKVESNGVNTDTVTLLDIQQETKKQDWTIGELDDYRSKDLKYTVKAADNNSNAVKVSVTVWDNADNQSTDEFELSIDTTAPVIEAKYTSEAEVQNEKYYKKPVQAEILYTERNFSYDKEYLWFEVQVEGKNIGTYSVKELQSELGIRTDWEKLTEEVQQDNTDRKALTDKRQHKLLLTFDKDNHYTFTPYIKDLAEVPENSVYAGETQNFVVDQKAPVMKVEYETIDGGKIAVPTQEENRIYSQKGIRAIVTIDEHNFALENQEIQVDTQVTATKEQETISDYYAQQRVNNGEVWRQQNIDSYASVYTFKIDANYTHSITYTDLAGNSVTYGPGYFTVDDTNPTGSVSINGFGFWETLLHNITFGLFNPSSVDVEMKAADYTSPINPIQYFRTADAMTREQLEAYNWGSTDTASWENPGYAAFTVNPDEQFIVYTKVTDYAGNYEYFSSDGMIVDSTKPAPKVTITNLSQSQNGIFNENVTLQIDVEDPYAGNTYSGLERVWYTVSATGNVSASETIEILNNENNRVQGNQTFSQVITVPANVYNSNDVKVQAFAVDFSGNQGESEITELKIDVTNPSISVSWDLNNPMNGKYYKETRTATVTVTDRNFDPNNVRFTITNTDGTQANIGGWSSSSNIGVSDSATSTCQVSFPADGDYTFTLGCTDLAGNSAEYGQTDEFTIDKTVPEISVSYDNNNARNGNYYKEARTATVTVREHNFNAADVKAAITASLEGRGISTPSISGFSGSGDVHTATVRYAADGDYTFDVEYTDMAGNQASDYTPDQFTVDLTAPEVEITDVEDKSANNDVVSPSVKATDVNYDSKNVTVTITGANNGKVDINKVVSAVENGQTMKFSDFARQEKMDDLYTLTAKAVDLAGNEKEESILFSVNRYGSVYVLDDDTKEWLSTKDYTYINEEKEVGVIEYNVDTIKDSTITVNRDGELVNLKAKTDYTVTSSGTEAQWKENHYTMKAENFAQEGNYAVILSTQDEAANAMNNTSVKKSSGNLPIEFAVDKTAPTVVISGVEDGGSYRSAERTMTVDAKDNLALDEVSVDIDGNTTVYQAEELKETDGVIDVVIGSANDFQEIQVTASDAAGNVLGQKQVNGKGEPVALSVLVTPNVMVQYYMNKPLFFGSIIGVLAVAGIIIFLVWRKRQADKNGR